MTKSEAHTNAQRNPEGQGGETPAGWKKTLDKPLPVAQCGSIAHSTGKRCNRWGLMGTTKVRELEDGTSETYGLCPKHGGQLPGIQKYAQGMVEAARLRLIGMSEMAIDTIEEIATNADGATNTRLKAATEILDRAGIRGGAELDVKVEVEHAETAADRARKMLAQTAERLEASRNPKPDDDEDIIDVEEETEI